MAHYRSFYTCLIFAFVVFSCGFALAQTGSFGIRGGIGTDISGGIAYGGSVNYQLPQGTNALEIGIMGFGGSFEEETEEEINTYVETTDLLVFALMANYLLNYSPDRSGVYVLAGVGVGAVIVEWEERSDTDTSLGTPLPNGGSKQSDDGSAGGSIVSVGVGMSAGNGFDLRVEVPVIITFSAPGEAASVIPTFTLTAGLRF